MPARLEQESVVLVGAWNPAIINPAWIRKWGIVKGVPETVNMGFQPLGRACQFTLAGLTWVVDDSRLIVQGKGGQGCGDCAAKVLKVLPHTPVQAIGDNFTFSADRKERLPDFFPKTNGLAVAGRSRALSLSQSTWEGVADMDRETVVKVRLTKAADGVVVSFNFHRNCSGAKQAGEFARRFPKDLSKAISILRKTLRITTE